MNLTKEKLNDMWRGGYCQETVEYAALTPDDMVGSTARVEFLESHVPRCTCCRFANSLKLAEHRVAQRMGPRSESAFWMGHDITKLPGYDEALVGEETKRTADSLGDEGDAFLLWMGAVAEREDLP